MANDENPFVDLTNCESEAIHRLGRIQPFAWLLAFSSQWRVCRVSRNIAYLLGRSADDLLGLSITELFSPEVVHSLRGRCSLLFTPDAVERIFGLRLLQPVGDARFDIALHRSGRAIVVEIEAHVEDHIGEATGLVRSMMSRLDGTRQLGDFLRIGARMVRATIGFDRVMVYRFDRDGHGTVVAESLVHGTDSFLGQHYPASDIPRQARELYLRTPFRIIADVAAEPVGIVPPLDDEGDALDLSLSVSRAVSPIHIEYLRNMGIAASLSISIIVDGQLWGLIACHHNAPLLPSFNARSVAELFGQMFSLRLEGRLRAEVVAQERRARAVAESLASDIADDLEFLSDPEHISATLRGIIATDGVGTLVQGRYGSVGLALPRDMVEALADQLNAMDRRRIYVVENASLLVPSAADHAPVAAGFMAIPISRQPRDYVFLFRKEQARTITWAGNPEKPVTPGENGMRLTPRGSFDAWLEEVRNSCEPFTESERYIGEALRSVLTEVVLRITDNAREESRHQAERQELLIAELNHRVRNILALVRGIVRQSDPGGGGVQDYIALLDGRIAALARAHDQITRIRWAAAPLRPLFADEAEIHLRDGIERLVTDGPDIDLEPEAYAVMALIVHELVTNSVKYGALSADGTVQVRWDQGEQGELVIEWRESGGPPVTAPARRGFGSTIIERTVPRELGGEAEMAFHESGLFARFVVPARFVRTGASQRSGASEHPGPDAAAAAAQHRAVPIATPTSLGHVLVVEDSLIIAMDVEEHLRAHGVGRVTIAASVDQALRALDREEIAGALVDVNLGPQHSLPVAEELLRRGIPFVLSTGYGEHLEVGEAFSAIPLLQKPYGMAELDELLRLLGADDPERAVSGRP